MSYEPLFVAYLVYFNRDRDYFECHEVLEELWLARGHDPLYKGLLQIAVGLFHARRGNLSGGRKMLTSALEQLTPYPEQSLGIDLGKLRREAEAYIQELANEGNRDYVFYDLTIRLMDPELIRMTEVASENIAPNIPQRRTPQRGEKHEERQQKLALRRTQQQG
ncbi:DUF309 domain-containing protein [Paenibacillus sp. MBLB2552]|uniref:DUF309 domain-containing protein n=1 Tax=Paenibacillus mellifer TaxID=2937794 RepID=A0A9X1Y0N9_9BACL|nr:DUF309 domain-containing protein [Paenibacillus mellifer]MCK8488784.1 DUF309 domain-containing protein [Paenibacillus mellifer]